MSWFKNKVEPNIKLPVHSLRSSYSITRCPKCDDQIFGKYHKECAGADIEHIHCKSRCGYEFVTHPNDYQYYTGRA